MPLAADPDTVRDLEHPAVACAWLPLQMPLDRALVDRLHQIVGLVERAGQPGGEPPQPRTQGQQSLPGRLLRPGFAYFHHPTVPPREAADREHRQLGQPPFNRKHGRLRPSKYFRQFGIRTEATRVVALGVAVCAGSGEATMASSGKKRLLLLCGASLLTLQIVAAPLEFSGSANGLAAKSAYAQDASCFVAGTLVLMADGSERPIEALRPGDVVLGRRGRVNRVVASERTCSVGAGSMPSTAGDRSSPPSTPSSPARAGRPSIPRPRIEKTTGYLCAIATRRPDLSRDGAAGRRPRRLVEEGRGLLFLQSVTVLEALAAVEDDPNTPLFNLLLDGDHSYVADGWIVHNKEGDSGGSDGGGSDGGGSRAAPTVAAPRAAPAGGSDGAGPRGSDPDGGGSRRLRRRRLVRRGAPTAAARRPRRRRLRRAAPTAAAPTAAAPTAAAPTAADGAAPTAAAARTAVAPTAAAPTGGSDGGGSDGRRRRRLRRRPTRLDGGSAAARRRRRGAPAWASSAGGSDGGTAAPTGATRRLRRRRLRRRRLGRCRFLLSGGDASDAGPQGGD